MTDTYEIPDDVRDAISDDGQTVTLQNTLLKIWHAQAEQAMKDLDSHTRIGFGFAVNAAQRWNLSTQDDVERYTLAFIESSRAFWSVILDAAEQNPSALKQPEKALDGEENKDLYVELVNTWFKLAWQTQVDWTIEDGMAAAYGIQDVMESFIGSNGMVTNLSQIPGFDSSDVVLWTPGED